MQPDALNLAIAQSIEPEASLLERPRNGDAPFSPLKAWKMMTRFAKVTFEYQWVPRDFINDPSLSFLLLKRLAADGDEPQLFFHNGKRAGWFAIGSSARKSSNHYHAEPGPAIAEYYARAHNIYKETE